MADLGLRSQAHVSRSAEPSTENSQLNISSGEVNFLVVILYAVPIFPLNSVFRVEPGLERRLEHSLVRQKAAAKIYLCALFLEDELIG